MVCCSTLTTARAPTSAGVAFAVPAGKFQGHCSPNGRSEQVSSSCVQKTCGVVKHSTSRKPERICKESYACAPPKKASACYSKPLHRFRCGYLLLTQNDLSCCVGRQALPINEISRLGQNRRSQEERAKVFATAVTKRQTSLDSECSRGAFRCTDRVETTEQGS